MSAPAIISSGTAAGGPPVGGSGTANTIPRWTGATTLGDSGLIDNGTAIYTTTRNFGIGTAAPATRLHVLASADAHTTFASSSATRGYTEYRYNTSTILGYVGTASGLISGGASSDFAFRVESGNNIAFATGTAERARIDANGNLGIGTAAPTGRLHVVGGTAAASTNGAPVTIIAQTAGSGNQNGGNIVLTPGSKTGTGTDGLVDLSSPSGTGLKLPAAPGNADTQTLDCYAEGTWTPTLSAAATWGGTAPTVNFANYTRVGRLIFFEIELAPTAATAFSTTWGTSSFTLPVSAPRSTAIAVNRNAASANAVTSGANLLLPTLALLAENLRVSGVYAI